MSSDEAVSNKVAMYHVPLYPSARSYDTELSVLGRKHWQPLFAEKRLTLGFENHDHTLKRTIMMGAEGPVSSGGMVFVGDGCWGRTVRKALHSWYMELVKDVRTGFNYTHRFMSTEPAYDMRLKFKTERRSGFQAKVEIRGNSEEREHRLYDTTVNYKLSSLHQLELGYDKILLGNEYLRPSQERVHLRRTLLYRYMENVGFQGRQHQMALHYNEVDQPLRYSLQVGGIDGESLNLYGLFQYSLNPFHSLGISGGTQRDYRKHQTEIVPVMIFSHSLTVDRQTFETELAFGGDPVESEFEKLYGDNTDEVYWYAAKAQYSWRFNRGSKAFWEPFAALTYLRPDHKMSRRLMLELYAGLNVHLEKVVRSANFDLVGHQSELKSVQMSLDESQILIEARRYF